MKKYIIILLLLIFANSCALVPFISSYKEMGVTAADRQALLQKQTKKFNKAYSSNHFTEASVYVADEYRQEFFETVRGRSRKEKLVDSKVDLVEMDEDARECNIDVIIRYYQIPFYIVKDRVYKQSWKFDSGHWKLFKQEIVKES